MGLDVLVAKQFPTAPHDERLPHLYGVGRVSRKVACHVLKVRARKKRFKFPIAKQHHGVHALSGFTC